MSISKGVINFNIAIAIISILISFSCKNDSNRNNDIPKKKHSNIVTKKTDNISSVKSTLIDSSTILNKKSGVKIIFDNVNIKNINGSGAAAIEINNLTDAEIGIEVDNISMDSLINGGKGIVYNNGQNIESKSFIRNKFPNLYNLKFWKQSRQKLKYANIPSKNDIFKESYSSSINKDQYGASYLQVRNLKIVDDNGEVLIEKPEYIGIDPILINEEMLQQFQALEHASSNFGEPSSPEISLNIEDIDDSCIYFILLKFDKDELVFLTGRDKCMPWKAEFASWEAYVKSETLNLTNYLKKY